MRELEERNYHHSKCLCKSIKTGQNYKLHYIQTRVRNIKSDSMAFLIVRTILCFLILGIYCFYFQNLKMNNFIITSIFFIVFFLSNKEFIATIVIHADKIHDCVKQTIRLVVDIFRHM